MLLEQRVYPCDGSLDRCVFYTMPGYWIVFHDFAGSAPSLAVYLIEDCVTGFCDSDVVFLHETIDCVFVKEGTEEFKEVTWRIGPDGLMDKIHWNSA